MQKIKVNTKFDGGSIEVVNIDNPRDLHFKIKKDTNSQFAQWFYFQLNNVVKQQLKIKFSGQKETAYPDGWKNYNICMSYDNQNWVRLETQFDGVDVMTFELQPESNSVYFAYFEPYSYHRHQELIGEANLSDIVRHEVLGQTRQGRNIDLLVVGDELAVNKIWIIARQHPGETMAEWFMEGLIHKLIDYQDSTSVTLLKDCVFYLVPNMNPDGGYCGNLRVNTLGINLNREWLSPSLEKSPEVYYVQEKMLKTGVSMFFDIHGDESIPYVFFVSCEDNPSFSKKQAELTTKFMHYCELINPDCQTIIGYEKGHFNTETATVATNWVGNQFDCLSFTLEMPFKDNDNLPDLIHNWDGRRSYLLGESLLTAINLVKRI